MKSSAKRLLGSLGAIAFLAIIGVVVADEACAGTLDRIRQQKEIRLAYRVDAPPFSYKNSIGEPAGFMVDLCRAVAAQLAQQLELPTLNVTYVTATAVSRFEAIEQNKADLLCDPTTATLSRRALVDFSIATYIDGAGLMVRSDGPRDLQGMSGQKIGVLGGTTTEEALRNALKDAGVSADVVLTKTYSEGLAMLDQGTISAFFGDRDILTSLVTESKAPGNLLVGDNYLTVEPYALALSHGDEDFRLAVDEALSHIYRSNEIGSIYVHTFGEQVKPSTLLKSVYIISGLPD